MDTIKEYRIEKRINYHYETACGEIRFDMRSSLSKDTYKLRVSLERASGYIYPQKFTFKEGEKKVSTYEIWNDNDIIDNKKMELDLDYLDYFFVTENIHEISFWADSLISLKEIYCSVDTLSID